MKTSNAASFQDFTFQLQLGGFLVIAIALRGLATSQGPAEERPLLMLALVGGVIAIAAGAAIRRRWTRSEAAPMAGRSTDSTNDRDAFVTGNDEWPWRRDDANKPAAAGLDGRMRRRERKDRPVEGGRFGRLTIHQGSHTGQPH